MPHTNTVLQERGRDSIMFKNHSPCTRPLLCTLFVILVLGAGLSIGYTVNSYKKAKVSRLDNCSPKAGNIPQTTENATGKRVVLIGDSRILEWGKPGFGENVEVINLGIAGETTGETLCRIDDRVLNLAPDWYIVEVGINDMVAASMLSREERKKILDQSLRNIKQITTRLSSGTSKVLLLTVPPPISPDIIRSLVWGNSIEETTEELSYALLNELPENIHVYDMKKIFFDHNTNSWKTEFSRNALHWNSIGYAVLNTEVMGILFTHPPH